MTIVIIIVRRGVTVTIMTIITTITRTKTVVKINSKIQNISYQKLSSNLLVKKVKNVFIFFLLSSPSLFFCVAGAGD